MTDTRQKFQETERVSHSSEDIHIKRRLEASKIYTQEGVRDEIEYTHNVKKMHKTK